MPDIVKVLINSIVAFVYLFIIARLMGKKQIAQLTFVDYVIGISIGSIAAEFATDVDTPWYYYILSIAIFFVLNLFISLIFNKAQWLKRLLQGTPSVLINDGKIDYDELKRCKLDLYDLMSLARERNIFDLSEISYAVLEVNGQLSVLPKGNKRPVVAEDFDNIKLEQTSMANYVVIDGKISHTGISDLNVSEEWVLNKLGVKNKDELKNIALAIYDPKLDKFNIHYKNRKFNKNNNAQNGK